MCFLLGEVHQPEISDRIIPVQYEQITDEDVIHDRNPNGPAHFDNAAGCDQVRLPSLEVSAWVIIGYKD